MQASKRGYFLISITYCGTESLRDLQRYIKRLIVVVEYSIVAAHTLIVQEPTQKAYGRCL